MKYKVLFAQVNPCIRCFKEAIALTRRGHEVSLAFSADTMQVYGMDRKKVFREQIWVGQPSDLLDIAKWFDVVHCHNEPDTLATMATALGDVPSVHDCHDMMSCRGMKWDEMEEAIANRNSAGLVYVSEYQYKVAQMRYTLNQPHAILPTYVNKDMVPKDKELMDKRSSRDLQIHLVYTGGVSRADNHRNLFDIFEALLECGYWVHCYALGHPDVVGGYQKELDNPRFILHKPVPVHQLIKEISQYDAGLCIFNQTEANRDHLHAVLPNKMFEYLAAGLPVICNELNEMVHFINTTKNTGMVCTDPRQIQDNIERLRRMPVDRHRHTMERQIKVVEALYKQIITKQKRPTLDAYVNMDLIEFTQSKKNPLTAVGKSPNPENVQDRVLAGSDPCRETRLIESIVANGMIEQL